jgi:hypothetical protein
MQDLIPDAISGKALNELSESESEPKAHRGGGGREGAAAELSEPREEGGGGGGGEPAKELSESRLLHSCDVGEEVRASGCGVGKKVRRLETNGW